ncbi:hypothetical protein HHX47_DHR5000353 [Lentinula edodes]|nr:hypothetical protein HHX47_DHR5000353 [Lentinula edodes]
MSDREGLGASSSDDDLSLPKATVAKMITANDICEKESKKTIAPEHIISALKALGFDQFTSEVEDVLKDHKQQQKDREKKVSKFEQSGKTEEELLAEQEKLFAASRAKFQPSNAPQ